MTMITPSYLGETIEYSSLHACRSTLEDPIDKRVTPHIFRHTYGSIATELGYSELTVKGLIGHAKVGTTQLYMHVPDPALLMAADRVAARIAAALDGGAEVIPLRVTA